MVTQEPRIRPMIGMILAFKRSVDTSLAGIPARVALIWRPIAPDDDEVTLEYEPPVYAGGEPVRFVDAKLRDLYRPSEHEPCSPGA